MTLLYLLVAALMLYIILSTAETFEATLVEWVHLLVFAAAILGALMLAYLSFLLAEGLGVLRRIAAELPRIQPPTAGPSDPPAAPTGGEAGNMRDWVQLMGVLSLLPILLFAHHVWSETALLDLPDRSELRFLGGFAIVLLTLSFLSFAVAKRLDLQERIAVHLPPLHPSSDPEQPPSSASGESGSSAPPPPKGASIRLALQMVGIVCLVPTAPLAYGIFSSPVLPLFPHWGWGHLAFVEAFIFGMATLSLLSFAAAKHLDLADRIAAHLPALRLSLGERSPRAPARDRFIGVPLWPHLIGTLCLLLAPLPIYGMSDPWHFDAAALSFTATLVFALVTVCCLVPAAGKGLPLLRKIAVELPRLHPPPGAEEAAVMPLGEELMTLPPPAQPERKPPAVPPHEAAAKKALSSRARRLILFGIPILALAAAAFASYHLDPMHGWAHINRGVALADLGRHKESLAQFDRAVRLLPDDATAHYDRGWALAELGRFEEALAACDRTIQLEPHHASAHAGRGSALGDLGRYEQALGAFDRAAELDPDLAWAHNGRGRALAELGEYEKALAAYDRAVELDPDLAYAHNGRGWTLGNLGRHEEALDALDRAIRLEPSYALAYYNRARVYSLLGKRNEGVRDLRRAIELDGKMREPARTDEGFANLRSDPEFRELVGPGAHGQAP
jgi:tetratricopeptide (TPR) repeat protein